MPNVNRLGPVPSLDYSVTKETEKKFSVLITVISIFPGR